MRKNVGVSLLNSRLAEAELKAQLNWLQSTEMGLATVMGTVLKKFRHPSVSCIERGLIIDFI